MDNEIMTKKFSFADIKKKIKELSTVQKLIIIFIILAIIGVIIALVSLGHKEGKSPKYAMETDYIYMYNNFNDYAQKYVKFAGRVADLPSKEDGGETKFLTIEEGFDDPQKCIYITLNDAIDVNSDTITNGTYVLVVGKVGRLSPAFNGNAFSGEGGLTNGQLSVVKADIVATGDEAMNFFLAHKDMSTVD